MKRKNALILAIIWLLVMVGIVASTVTLLTSNGIGSGSRWVNSDEYAIIERYRRLDEVRSRLSEDFYMEINDDALITGAIRGMTAAANDIYTFYYTPEEMAAYNEKNGSAYVGVGLIVQNNEDGRIEVVRVYEGGPAGNAEMLPGDYIVGVNGEAVSGRNGQSLNDAVNKIKGETGTQVVLSVLRDGETLEFSMLRGEVNISNVDYEMLNGDIGYISIYQFSGDASDGFQSALKDLESRNAQGLVIDLRNNPGGLLDHVVEIADALLPAGTIVYTQDRDGSRTDYYSDENCCNLPLVVLINGMSASASEILAASVQDYERGSVVGEQTYGKGIVQTVITFEEDGAGLQYTSSCYFTPNGNSIHGQGVTPDIVVESDADAFHAGFADPVNDLQLRAALKELSRLMKESA